MSTNTDISDNEADNDTDNDTLTDMIASDRSDSSPRQLYPQCPGVQIRISSLVQVTVLVVPLVPFPLIFLFEKYFEIM